MQIGDKVHCTGTVKDIVGGSVLVLTDATISDPGREYWFLEAHVAPLAEASEPAPPAPPPAP